MLMYHVTMTYLLSVLNGHFITVFALFEVTCNSISLILVNVHCLLSLFIHIAISHSLEVMVTAITLSHAFIMV